MDALQEIAQGIQTAHYAEQKWFPKQAIRRSWFARSLQAIDHEQIRQDAAGAVGVRLTVRTELDGWNALHRQPDRREHFLPGHAMAGSDRNARNLDRNGSESAAAALPPSEKPIIFSSGDSTTLDSCGSPPAIG